MQPFSLVFWAVFCVLAGIVLLIRQFARTVFSPSKVIGGLFILLLGISLLLSPSSGISTNDQVVFDQGSAVMISGGEHSCVFGQSTVDLTSATSGSDIEINCVFGQCDVKLPADVSVDVTANCAFGSVSGVDIGSVSFGEAEYLYPGEGEPIKIEINTVFGQTTLIR